ncbi:hypothetical protein [Micromonospora sp. NPDC023814]|uniref:hypothetical protein n=1 Tax=Micromonospora sp. NPDC023814 TaxID=3154596 RepID=UPI0033F1465C
MPLWADFHDLPDGTVRMTFDDGSSTLLSSRSPDAHVLMQRTEDGTEFSDFQGENPGQVRFPDGSSGEYNYLADGRVELVLSDGSVTVMSGTGEDAVILTQTTPDGDVYSQFDAQGHPGHVEFHQ